MKTFLALSLSCVLTTSAFALNCTNFSGKYQESKSSWTLVVKQNSCDKIEMIYDEQAVRTVIFDGVQRPVDIFGNADVSVLESYMLQNNVIMIEGVDYYKETNKEMAYRGKIYLDSSRNLIEETSTSGKTVYIRK